MANRILHIKNLSLTIKKKNILNKINLNINRSEIHLLIGPNGSGKSTLLKTIMFDDNKYQGDIFFDDKNLYQLKTVERSKEGIFLAFQEPVEVQGVSVVDFLRLSYNTIHPEDPIDPWTFRDIFTAYTDKVGLNESFYERNLNEGFSGGEKKKMEIVQMMILKPKLALLDEIDSGLDYRSVETIFDLIKDFVKNNNSSVLLVSHNKNILDYIKPDHIHFIEDGVIKRSGGKEIIDEL